MLTKPQNKEYVTVGALIKLYEDSPESNEEDIKVLLLILNYFDLKTNMIISIEFDGTV